MSMSVDKILAEFKDINYAYNDSSKFDTLKRMLNEAVEPVHGEWNQIEIIDNYGVNDDASQCSVCGCVFDYWTKTYFKYCPNCGAVMDGKEKGNEQADN